MYIMNNVKRGNYFILFVMLYSIIASIVAQAILYSIYGENIPITWLILSAQLFVVGFPSLVYFLTQKDTKIPHGKLSFVEVILIILLTFMISPALSLINVLSQFFVQNKVVDLMSDMFTKPLWFVIILTALTPAILEELLTRAIIINNYMKQTVFATMLISGLFFGFIHMNINQFLYAFVMGMLLCYIVLITESIYASMLMHFVVNASGTLLFRFSIESQKWLAELEGSNTDTNEILKQLSDSTAAIDTSQLIASAIAMLIISIVTLPIAGVIIFALLKGRKKHFSGSFRKTTAEFMGGKSDKAREVESVEIREIDGEIKVIEKGNKNKVLTWTLIASAIIFLAFSILTEFILK